MLLHPLTVLSKIVSQKSNIQLGTTVVSGITAPQFNVSAKITVFSRITAKIS